MGYKKFFVRINVFLCVDWVSISTEHICQNFFHFGGGGMEFELRDSHLLCRCLYFSMPIQMFA
jgi:hypothetical protein